MKTFKVTLVHNPQDYFNGSREEEELAEAMTLDTSSDLIRMLGKVYGGYKAIVTLEEGDNSG